MDPLAPSYPELTTYQFASNRPISAIDLDGLEALESNIAFGLSFTASIGTMDTEFSTRMSMYSTLSSQFVSLEMGLNVNIAYYKQKFGNTTGGGLFFNPEAFFMAGGGDNSNMLGANVTGKGMNLFNPNSKSKFFGGVGYAYNLNQFTGGLEELSNRTGGLLLRGSFGDNSLAFTMYNDTSWPPHWGGGTDHGITGTGELSYTRGIDDNSTFRLGAFFADITAVRDGKNYYSEDSEMYKTRNHGGKTSNNVVYTKGINKDLNFGMLGVSVGYSTGMFNVSARLYAMSAQIGAKVQDSIHNQKNKKGQYKTQWLFPYDGKLYPFKLGGDISPSLRINLR